MRITKKQMNQFSNEELMGVYMGLITKSVHEHNFTKITKSTYQNIDDVEKEICKRFKMDFDELKKHTRT